MTHNDSFLPLVGDYEELTCPYCYETISEVWEYDLKLDAEDDADSLECHHCNKKFIVTKMFHDSPLESRQMYDGFKDARAKYELQLASYSKSLKQHFLYDVVDTAEVQAYYLKAPGKSRWESTYIMFTQEGIVLSGDLCPGYGVVSNYGYGLEWFRKDLSPGYLCEKFMMVDKLSPDHALLVAIQRQFVKAYQDLSLETALD